MTYEEWLQSVPPEITADPLWQMRVYRLALFAGDLGWQDVSVLAEDARMRGLADQLYRALGSIAATSPKGTVVVPGKSGPGSTNMPWARRARPGHGITKGATDLKTPLSIIGPVCSPRLSGCSCPSFLRSGRPPVS